MLPFKYSISSMFSPVCAYLRSGIEGYQQPAHMVMRSIPHFNVLVRGVHADTVLPRCGIFFM